MANITKTQTIPDAIVPRLVAAFGADYKTEIVDENGDTVANPETKAQYASRRYDELVKDFVKRHVKAYEEEMSRRAISVDEFDVQ